MGIFRFWKRTKSAELASVIMEDTLALIGLAFAFIGIGCAIIFDNELLDFEIEPRQRRAHIAFDLVDGLHVVVTVELGRLHFETQQDVVLRHVHGLHIDQLFHAVGLFDRPHDALAGSSTLARDVTKVASANRVFSPPESTWVGLNASEKKAERLMQQGIRLHAKATKAVAAQNMMRRAEKLLSETSTAQKREKVADIRFPEPAPCGRTPIEAKDISKAYGSNVFSPPESTWVGLNASSPENRKDPRIERAWVSLSSGATLRTASRQEILKAIAKYEGAIVLVTHDEGAVEALRPERVLLMPDGDEDLWNDSLLGCR